MHQIILSAGGLLPFLSALAIGFVLLTYVLLDGADLGVGMLFGLLRDTNYRDTMAVSILPVWDANETWLVLAGGGTLALFPIAFSTLLTAFYFPLIVMLISLAVRSTALEFRGAGGVVPKPYWDVAFCLGSFGVAFTQGVIAGAFIHGFAVSPDTYADGWGNWFSAFSLCCGVGTVAGYTTLGAAWLIYRTTDELQLRVRRHALVFGTVTLVMLVCLSVWTPALDARYAHRWATAPGPVLLGSDAALIILSAAAFGWSVVRRVPLVPLASALAIVVLSFLAISLTVFPMTVPPGFTIGQAAAPRATELFVLSSMAIVVPLILLYSTFSFFVFRGKVKTESEARCDSKVREAES